MAKAIRYFALNSAANLSSAVGASAKPKYFRLSDTKVASSLPTRWYFEHSPSIQDAFRMKHTFINTFVAYRYIFYDFSVAVYQSDE